MSWLRRRRLIVDPFQYRLLWSSILHFAAAGVVFGTILFMPLALQLMEPDLPVQQRAAVAEQLLNLNQRLWPALIVMCVLVGLHSLINSHRVAGPLYRVRTILESIREGDYLPFNEFRKNDYLPNLGRALRKTLSVELDRLRGLDAGQRAIERQLTLLESALATGALPSARVAAEQLREDTDRMGAALATLRLYPDDPEPIAVPEIRLLAEGEERQTRLRTGTDPGFSLIEVMIVSALIAVLSAIGVPSYMETLDNARVAKAIGDIDAISLRLEEMMTADGLPASLAEIGYGDYLDPYGNNYQYNANLGSGPGGARKDKFLKPLNSDFDVYSMGADGVSVSNINNKKSKDDIIRAANGGFIGLAEDY